MGNKKDVYISHEISGISHHLRLYVKGYYPKIKFL